jgi:hypothetical protein
MPSEIWKFTSYVYDIFKTAWSSWSFYEEVGAKISGVGVVAVHAMVLWGALFSLEKSLDPYASTLIVTGSSSFRARIVKLDAVGH